MNTENTTSHTICLECAAHPDAVENVVTMFKQKFARIIPSEWQ